MPHLAAAYPSTRVIYGKVALVASDGRVLEIRGQPWPRARRPFLQALPVWGLPHQGVLHHRSIFQHSGLFDESFRFAGDFELQLRTLKDSTPLFVPNVIMAGMEYGDISTDPQNAVEILHELARVRRMNEIQGVPLLGTGNMPTQRLVTAWRAPLAAELRSTRQTSTGGLQADSRFECQGNRRKIPPGVREICTGDRVLEGL